MIAVGYARVSTASQSEEGISLEAQQHRIQCWCQANGYQLQRVFVEARSAVRADNRPQLQVALSQACHSKAALVVYSLSRLARSTKDASDPERLDKAGADLVSLSERIDSTSRWAKWSSASWPRLASLKKISSLSAPAWRWPTCVNSTSGSPISSR